MTLRSHFSILQGTLNFRKCCVSTFWILSSSWICGVTFTIASENFNSHFTDFLLLYPFFPITNPKKGLRRKGDWLVTFQIFSPLPKASQNPWQMQGILCLSGDILFQCLKDIGRKFCWLLLAPSREAVQMLYTARSKNCTCKNESKGNGAYVYRINKSGKKWKNSFTCISMQIQWDN